MNSPDPQFPGSGDAIAFDDQEIATILSHFGIGSNFTRLKKPYRNGLFDCASVRSADGQFLVSRYRGGQHDVEPVEGLLEMHRFLIGRGFPLLKLRHTVLADEPVTSWRHRIYQLYDLPDASPYDWSESATRASGRVLARLHKLLSEFTPAAMPPLQTYHTSAAAEGAFDLLFRSSTARGAWDSTTLDIARSLRRTYISCGEKVSALGFDTWPGQVVDGDWHGGRLLFERDGVVAVLDAGSIHFAPRVIDFAHGALAFSWVSGGRIEDWPEWLDETRFKAFARGYDEIQLLSRAEIKAVPFLMAQSLIVAVLASIATTGPGTFSATDALAMAERKTTWLMRHGSND